MVWMKTTILILAAPAVVAAFVIYRLAVGRPPRRRAMDVWLALLLLVYFTLTAALGVFWVANHQLPVFDLHYLLGYVTFALVACHVALNWKVLVGHFRRGAPRRGRTWRAATWTLGLACFGAVCFWVGMRYGGTRIEVIAPGSPADPIAAAGRPMPRVLIRVDGRETPLAEYYHQKTKHTRRSVVEKGRRLDWSTRPNVFKEYPDAETVDLPEDTVASTMPTGDAVTARRRPVTGFVPARMSLVELSTLLRMTNSITATRQYPGLTYHLRTAPSAGALYPTVTYVLVRDVEGLRAGLYHYAVNGHKMHRLRADAEELADLTGAPDFVRRASVTLIFSTVFFRSSWKYGQRAYRYCCLDAGHVAGNATLAASAMGYASRLVGRFDDAKLNALLGLDEGAESVLLVVPVGKPAAGVPTAAAPAFVSDPRGLEGPADKLLMLVHGRTGLRLPSAATRPAKPTPPDDKTYDRLPSIPLPRDVPKGDALFAAILRRRSARNWAERGMKLEELSSVLYHAFGVTRRDGAEWRDPSVESADAIRLYVIVNNVDGLDRGVYYYRRRTHALTALNRGDQRRRSHEIALFQRLVGSSCAALVKTIDTKRLAAADGDRGYRYAVMDAGLIGENLYLQAEALGLGCCGIGAFFDDEVSEVIGAGPKDELIIYLSAVGVRSGGAAR